MTTRLIYQVHKWLALVLVAATLGWFVSGAVMSMPGHWRSLSSTIATGGNLEARFVDAPALDNARVPIATAIATVRAQTGDQSRVTALRLRRLPGRLAYDVSTLHGTSLVDAMSGDVFTVDEALAERVARAALGISGPLGPATLQQAPLSDYRGPFPAFRVPAEDGKGTVIYVSADTGEVSYSDRLTRVLRPIRELHDFSIAAPLLPAGTIRLALFASSILGTAMTIAGAWILLLQFQGWRRKRRRTDVNARRSGS